MNYETGLADEVLARKCARRLGKPEWIGLPLSVIAERLIQDNDFFDSPTTPALSALIEILDDEYASALFSDFNAPGEPHAMLAQFPCEVFVTACIDSFMEDALKTQGKHPQSATLVSARKVELKHASVDEPVVFHVFGRIDDPRSLILTATDKIKTVR
jgi:hypothetical protein